MRKEGAASIVGIKIRKWGIKESKGRKGFFQEGKPSGQCTELAIKLNNIGGGKCTQMKGSVLEYYMPEAHS